MSADGGPPDPFADAMLAARLCAIDPVGLGGLVLRGGGEAREAVVAALRDALPTGAPMWRLPVHADDAALFGGLDLTATLASGRPVRRAGLLEAADGGLVVVSMAERLPEAMAARIAAAMEAGEVEGAPARFVLVLLDDGVEADERPPGALAERLAFSVDLTAADRSMVAAVQGTDTTCSSPRPCAGVHGSAPPTKEAHAARWMPGQARHDGLAETTADHLTALATTAAALGANSARATLFALRAARAVAALAGRDAVADEDLALAARLVLAPRATRLPAPAPDSAPEPPPLAEHDTADEERGEPAPLDDIVLAAALATLPPDVLARLAAGRQRGASRAQGGGERRRSVARGRPLGARAGVPGSGRRLALIDTLRAAAPWQRLRGGGTDEWGGRVRIRRDDLRVRRFETRAEATTIFAVDASGSAALTRLAEAKGAVELLLAQAYVKRAQVALIAFRGAGAELLLPPTRSLARARRSLADLPGGGGTPLAAGLAAAHRLAEAARARGRTPFVVVLTDGRGNVAADGGTGRAAAESDARAAARAIGAAGIGAAFVDISPRPRTEGAALAAAMGARYLPLPRADAAAMHAAVVEAQRG